MIRNVVFDIGGVLADFRVKEFLADMGFDGDMIRRILRASVMTPYWGKFERDEITEEEALQGFISTDPEMYRMFLTTCGLKAEECLFVDDTAENVEAARALGFDGIVFETPEKLMEELRGRGIRL